MSPALQIYSRDFDAGFFKLPAGLQTRIESSIDRLGLTLDSYPHHRMKGVDAYRFRVDDRRSSTISTGPTAFYICWPSA